MLRLLRDMPTMACILAPMLERLFLSSVPTVPTAVSDWLPSVFSRLHMSPLILVLLVMFMPPDEPICLFFILDAKSLSATRHRHAEEDGEAGEDRGERTGRRRGDGGREEEEEERRTGEEKKVWGGKERRTEFRIQEFMTYSIAECGCRLDALCCVNLLKSLHHFCLFEKSEVFFGHRNHHVTRLLKSNSRE